ncbi:hypothetical protein Dsin_022619 [Dipteronia sinensis]|uniref:Peptidase A1 domain-containing protein n=1 Tax=Dipteronia sinensis TaxID=43782 RepID=A0AAE0A1Y4_9ROSI|nr:hypothetical protein Dsin_022619 [Dipteronia sinensis]
MGLDLAPDSLLIQLGDNIKGRFSYCMAPFSVGTDPLKLRFGDDIPSDTGVQTTPYTTVSNVNYYVLNLLDISVNSIPLRFPAGTFQGGTTLGFIIDSGVPFTLIDEHTNKVNAYTALTEALQKHYDSFGLQRRVLPGNDQVCYEDNLDFDQHPSITYHFEGANYTVDSRFVITIFGVSESYFCVNVLKGNGVSILGANDQQNMRIIYDNNINSIQFVPEECEHDTA